MHLKAYTPEDVFSIPYRCLYSKNIANLFLAGRAISVSHVAFGATRQMATCALCGQAAGTAAALALKAGILPRDVLDRIDELQQALLKDDCYIPGVPNRDEADLARAARVTCSSHAPGGECANVVNGWARRIGEAENAWISQEPAEGQWLGLDLGREAAAREVRLTFDTNLSGEIKISISPAVLKRQGSGIFPQLVRDYNLDLCRGESVAEHVEVRGNYLRHRVHAFERPVRCDRVRLTVLATHGDPQARVFEVRAYE